VLAKIDYGVHRLCFLPARRRGRVLAPPAAGLNASTEAGMNVRAWGAFCPLCAGAGRTHL